MLAEAGINPDDPGSWLDEQLRAAGALAPGTSVAGLWARPLVTSLGERGFNHHVLALRVEYSHGRRGAAPLVPPPEELVLKVGRPGAALQRERDFYQRFVAAAASAVRVPRCYASLAPTGRRTSGLLILEALRGESADARAGCTPAQARAPSAPSRAHASRAPLAAARCRW